MTDFSAGAANALAWVKVNWLFVLFLTAIASAFIFLRSKPTDVEALGGLDATLTNGQPAVLEFYSNF